MDEAAVDEEVRRLRRLEVVRLLRQVGDILKADPSCTPVVEQFVGQLPLPRSKPSWKDLETRKGRNAAEYLAAEYAAELEAKTLSRPELRRRDHALYQAFALWVGRRNREDVPIALHYLLETTPKERVSKELADLGIYLLPLRKKNSKRPHPPWLTAWISLHRKVVETAGSLMQRCMPKSIHAVTAAGFELKVVLFVLGLSLHHLLG